ncbi:MAG: serine protein kinase RIO [Pseudomonadales bacterium]|nr:serine protein kinase RIO [Pseudomonadales bacterium]
MKIPAELKALIEDGMIETVIRSLKSGKEAAVYVVRAGGELRCAKVYKNMAQRSFQQRARYQEGRQVRGSRQARAMNRRTRFGRREEETAWKNAEVDALYQLREAGVRVPVPHGYADGVLIMELVTDAQGNAAPGLGQVELTEEQARVCHRFLIGQIQRMLCAGIIHGDLSEYNVLVGADGPVIIDLPQAVNAAGNNSARAMLLRDVANVTTTLARFAPDLLATRYGEELWALFESGRLAVDSALTGEFVDDTSVVDVAEIRQIIDHARDEAERRQRGREAAEGLRDRTAAEDDPNPVFGPDG